MHAPVGLSAPVTTFAGGFRSALVGSHYAFGLPAVRESYRKYVIAIALIGAAVWMLFVAGLIIALSFTALPVIAIVGIAVIAAAVSLMFAPLVALVTVNALFPMLNEPLFFGSYEAIDPVHGPWLRAQPQLSFGRALPIHLRILGESLAISLVALLISLVPVVGPILAAMIGIYGNARGFAMSLCEPLWTRSVAWGFGPHQIWRSHRASLFGFTAPWLGLAMIPFVGGIAYGVAQASMAHLAVTWRTQPQNSLPTHDS